MSGSDEKIRAVLERVAREQAIEISAYAGELDEQDQRALLRVLEHRLLPFLLAGQAMRYEIVESSASHPDSDKQCPMCLSVQAWDNALAAAQGQPGDGK